MYMKTYYSTVFSSDEYKAILDGPNDWVGGWVLLENIQPT